MVTLKQYLAYSRAPFVTSSAVPVVLGGAAAWCFNHTFNLLAFALTMAGMVFVHFAVNLFNDYYDSLQGADQFNENRNSLGGGSGVIVRGEAPALLICNLGIFSLTMSLICGVTLMCWIDGGIGPIFWFMIAGFIGGFFYTAPPLKFAYRGWGEVDIFIALCVLPVAGTYYVLTSTLSWTPVIVSLPISFLMTDLLWINQFPDYPSDKASGKGTMVVRMGTSRARYVYPVLAVCAYICVAIPPLLMGWPKAYLLGLVGIIPSICAMRIIMRHHNEPKRIIMGQIMSITAHGLTGIFSAIGLLS